MHTNPNDPAQPTRIDPESFAKGFSIHDHSPSDFHATGLTKREYFAAMALSGLSHDEFQNGSGLDKAEIVANRAVRVADALIAALNGKEGQA